MRFRYWNVLLCLLLAACTRGRERAERTLREIGPTVLREEGALLYKEQFGGRGAGFAVVPEALWPRSFRGFQPRRVGAYADGFSLALETDADTEQGVFVVPSHFELRTPTGVGEARFERLAEGVYWYGFSRKTRGGY